MVVDMKLALSIIVFLAAITIAACNLPGRATASPAPVEEPAQSGAIVRR
jgi:hypothetical protein